MKKKILLSTLIVVLLLAGGGWWTVHHYTHRDISTADIGVEDNFFDFDEFIIEADISDGDAAGIESDPSIDTEIDLKTELPADHNVDTKKDSQETQVDPVSHAEKTPEAIVKQKYDKMFDNLQDVATSRLDTLANNALNDYKSGRSLRDVSSTYMSAANNLQDKVDDTFNKALVRMKQELDEKGLDRNLTKEVEASYHEAIANKKSELTNQMIAIIK